MVKVQFPCFHLEDKVKILGGGINKSRIDKSPLLFTYERKNKKSIKVVSISCMSFFVRLGNECHMFLNKQTILS